MTDADTTSQEAGSATGTGVGSTVSSAGDAIASRVSQAYNSAPDLGISSTVQAAYQNAPDVGLARTVSKFTGATGSRSNNSEDAVGTGDSNQESDKSSPDGQPANGAEVLQQQHHERVEESRCKGPSSESRVEKSQSQIGTEDGIPTSAGVGTTLSPDDKAQQSAKAGAERKNAHVPQDFEPVDCPSEFVTGKTNSAGNHRESHSSTADEDIADQSNSYGKSSDRKFAQKLKDKIKGGTKVVSGKVRGNDDKVAEGKAIQHGEA